MRDDRQTRVSQLKAGQIEHQSVRDQLQGSGVERRSLRSPRQAVEVELQYNPILF